MATPTGQAPHAAPLSLAGLCTDAKDLLPEPGHSRGRLTLQTAQRLCQHVERGALLQGQVGPGGPGTVAPTMSPARPCLGHAFWLQQGCSREGQSSPGSPVSQGETGQTSSQDASVFVSKWADSSPM